MTQEVRSGLVAGLIGTGIQGSRAPALHEQEGAEQGLRYVYKLIDLDLPGPRAAGLAQLLTAAEQLGFVGLNITYPCKQSILPLLSELSDEARAIGSVNTVLLSNGRRIGYNTDWWGFEQSFRRGLPDAALEHIVQLGAGGAGAAVAHAALMLGAKRLTIFDLDSARANLLATRLRGRVAGATVLAGADLGRALREADGLIHATPTGMAKYPGLPLPEALLHPALWVAEIVYFPLQTDLLRAARRLGCRTLDGGGMAVFQAVGAFRLFTGREPNAERMLRHFVSMN